MKTLTVILSFAALLLVGCGPSKWAQMEEVEAWQLVVPNHDTERGEPLFLFFKNKEPRTIKSAIINGILMGEFAEGDGIDGRFTDLIYEISEKQYKRTRNIYGYYTLVQWVLIKIQVDVVSGKSRRQHFFKETWIAPIHGRATARFEI
jgi:hypothetical protein